jgi:hypothetical protein
MVINVEYNQLDPLLRASGYPDGDVNSETGFSPFPGNINQVIIFHTYLNVIIPCLLLGWSDSMLICIVIMLYGVSSQIMMHHVLGLEY